MNCFEQSQTQHRRCETRGYDSVWMQRPIAEVAHLIDRLHQDDGFTAVERYRNFAIGNRQLPFCSNPRNGKWLKLVSIYGIRQPLFLFDAFTKTVDVLWTRQPGQQRDGVALPQLFKTRNGAAAILDMTRLTRSCIEQGPESVRCLSGWRRRHPVLSKQAIAHHKLLPAFEAQVPGRMGINVGIDVLVDGARATLHGFESFRGRKVGCGLYDFSDPLTILGIEIVTVR